MQLIYQERGLEMLAARVPIEEACILVIGSHPDNLITITSLLQKMQVGTVEVRTSGRQGVKRALSLPRIDMILLDMQLPHEDGYEILRHIRANPKLSNLRIVALAADTRSHSPHRARGAGFDGLIGQPINAERFPDQIAALLHGRPIWMLC